MQYKIKLSKKYKQHYKKLNEQDRILTDKVIQALSSNEVLGQRHQDHSLKGDFRNFRECHIKPNLLLVYQKQDDKLILYCLNLGSHSEIFK